MLQLYWVQNCCRGTLFFSRSPHLCIAMPQKKEALLTVLEDITYSGGQNIVDTLYMFYLYALTLGANNFWSVKIVVLYLVCNWRLKCFLSISVIEYPISLLLVLWGWILSASKSTPTQEFISKKSPPNLSSVLADCSCRDLKKSSSWGQKWGYWIFHGWNRLKTFQSSNTYQIQHHNFYRSKIISTQS